MTKNTNWLTLAAIAVALNANTASAQNLPTFDVGPLCRAEAKAAPEFSQTCMKAQKSAQDDLVRQWAQFAAADKTSCIRLINTIAGMQSYVELLTCLQMKQDVRNLPKQ
jgi:hypothetical protein